MECLTSFFWFVKISPKNDNLNKNLTARIMYDTEVWFKYINKIFYISYACSLFSIRLMVISKYWIKEIFFLILEIFSNNFVSLAILVNDNSGMLNTFLKIIILESHFKV